MTNDMSCLKHVIFYNKIWQFHQRVLGREHHEFWVSLYIGFKDHPFILEICKHQQLKVKGIMVSPTKHHVVILMMQVVTQNWKESV